MIISSGVNTFALSPCKDRMALDLYRFEHEADRDSVLWTPTVLCTGDLLRICRLLFCSEFK